MSKPTLSVILPNYNHAHYICEALEAILNQSIQPLEVIVVDDGSTDDSVTIIKQLAKRFPHINLICNDQNRGTVFSVSRALSLASGDYVYGAASDDKVLPGFFEKATNLLSQYPQAGLCCADLIIFDSRTGTFKKQEQRLSLSTRPRYFSPEELVELLRRTPFAISGQSIIKRSALVEAGNLIPELRWHSDWFLLYVIGFRHGICHIPEPLNVLRVSPDSYSASRQWSAQREVLNHLFRLLNSPTYHDVLPLFQRSRVMSQFTSEMVRLVLSHPEHWNYHSLSLIPRSLWFALLQWLAPITPSLVKRAYVWICTARVRHRIGNHS